MIFGGPHSGAVLLTVTSQQEGPQAFTVKSACSPCICVGFLRVHQLPDVATGSSGALQCDNLRKNIFIIKQ